MMIDVDWVYREFLRRGYKPEYAADFLDQAWKNSGKDASRFQRTEPDVFPFPPTVQSTPQVGQVWKRNAGPGGDVTIMAVDEYYVMYRIQDGFPLVEAITDFVRHFTVTKDSQAE